MFPASPSSGDGTIIMLDRGKIHTAKDFRAPKASHPPAPLPDATTNYLFCFDLFVRRNSFTGREPSFLSDVQNLVKRSGGMRQNPRHYLLNAMLALGAMQTKTIGVLEIQKNLRFAMESYLRSLAELREAVSNFSSSQRDSILWTTLFLGLFELMQDASGQKWLQHMVFGTSQALVASGPATCTSGTMQTFFIQARIFEVCRSIIFNQASFLAAPEWISLTDSLANTNVVTAHHSLDELLKLVVLCSALRPRTAEFIQFISACSDPESSLAEALSLTHEGFDLREALEAWKVSAVFPLERREEMLLSTIYYSATSIYLSGNYDYDLDRWHKFGLGVPTLDLMEIAKHFDSIVLTVEEALKASSLSPLLFLFPLRVAGARANQRWQQDIVTELLQEVRKQFVVADAMLMELGELWSSSIMVL
ncbi:C6 finger domain-containing protein [Colletotrichum tofieldiae]|uniref:C6 finger domain-containing protein n=1 Tax=Colletotrichum tofieldiae TaxID=708197 RepID=A0A166N9L9_9PEZI|nr:C6 finger domain-containing protein [Colletotrichum tofieldiae]